MQSPLTGHQIAQGAVLTQYHGGLVPARFSDPTTEHEAVRHAAGLFDFSFRSKFVLKGEHRAKFLHRIVSNDIKSLAPGQGTYATLLNAQGHILADLRVYVTADEILLDTDADLRDKAMQALQRYVIGDRVTIEPLDLFTLSVQGPLSRQILNVALNLTASLEKEYDHTVVDLAGAPARIVRATSTGEEGCEIWIDPERAPDAWKLLAAEVAKRGGLPCGWEALETLRIEAGIPLYGPELGEDTIPLEAGLLNALSFNKGCYIGQEIVERARSRGHVNWKLAGLVIDGDSPPPESGEKLVSDGKTIGEVTSACVSPTFGKTIALAYVRREVSGPGTKLAFESGRAAEVASLPFYRGPYAEGKGESAPGTISANTNPSRSTTSPASSASGAAKTGPV